MLRFVPRFLALTAIGLTLSACVTDPSMTGAAPGSPAVKTADLPKDAKLIEGVYSSKSDTQFTVPPVPVEKVPVEFQRQTVAYETDQPVGTIIINPGAKHLYLITGKNKAVRYGIAVGRAGFQWSGEALITDRKNWPTWTPPKEMIERKPELAKWEAGQPGGLENPLGARALYLTTNGVDYGYRIHGTPEWSSIGKSASSGCIRMINQDVMDLFDRVPDGTKVIVLNADGSMPKGLTLPPPQPKKAKPVAAKPAAPALTSPKPAVLPGAPGTPTTLPAAVVTAAPAASATTPAVTPAPVIAPAPAVAPAPAATVTPTVSPTVQPVAPAVQPAAPAVKTVTPAPCKVALVNGVCPAT